MSSVESEREMGSETTAQAPEQLSGVAVVIIIAVGVQTFIMLFIFAKRQIMRFTLRSRRGPHVSVGQGGVKVIINMSIYTLSTYNVQSNFPGLQKRNRQEAGLR